MNKTVLQIVKKHIVVSPKIAFYIRAAINDLNNGPRYTRDDDLYEWLGFIHAVSLISEWYNSNINDLWVNSDTGEVFTNEPQPYYDKESNQDIEPDWGNIYYLDRVDIKKILFDVLASYIS